MSGEKFDNNELVALRKAYEEACDQIGLGTEEVDRKRREQVAALIFALARSGDEQPESIQRRVVRLMRRPARGPGDDRSTKHRSPGLSHPADRHCRDGND